MKFRRKIQNCLFKVKFHTVESLKSGHRCGLKKCPFYGHVCFIQIPYKNEYLAKINQEWVFEVKGFHRVKKGHVE